MSIVASTDVTPVTNALVQKLSRLFPYEKTEDEILDWAKSHIILSLDVTLRIAAKIGYFKKVEAIGFCSRTTGNQGRNYLFLVNNKWQITVMKDLDDVDGNTHDFFKIENYQEIRVRCKAFGKRVSHLTNLAEVPWELGLVVAHIEDDKEALRVLHIIKKFKGNCAKYAKELTASPLRRSAALHEIFGSYFCEIDISSNRKQDALINYLLCK